MDKKIKEEVFEMVRVAIKEFFQETDANFILAQYAREAVLKLKGDPDELKSLSPDTQPPETNSVEESDRDFYLRLVDMELDERTAILKNLQKRSPEAIERLLSFSGALAA